MVNHYKELILEHRLEIFFKHFVTEKTLTDNETVNTTKEIHFFPSLKFVPHLEPVNLQEFCSSDSFMFLISSVERFVVMVVSPYILWKYLLLINLRRHS